MILKQLTEELDEDYVKCKYLLHLWRFTKHINKSLLHIMHFHRVNFV